MLNRNTKLLVRPKPFADESIAGYLLRLAEANEYESVSWLIKLFGMNSDFAYGAYSLKAFAEMTDVEQSALSQLCHKPTAGFQMATAKTSESFGQTISNYLIRTRNSKLCPLCLDENQPYLHKIWEIAIVTTCLKHKCILIDECPSCNKKIQWNRKKLAQCLCGFNFTKAKAVRIPESEIHLTKQIYHLLGLEGKPSNMLSEEILRLDLNNLVAALFLVISHRQGFLDTVGKRLCKSLNNMEMHNEMNSALNVFHKFPSNFYEFLNSCQNRQMEKRKNGNAKTYKNSKKNITFGGLMRVMYSFSKDEQTAFLYEACDNFYSHHKLKNLGLLGGNNVSDYFEFKKKYISKSEAKEILPAHFNLEDCLSANLLTPIEVGSKYNKIPVFIEKNAVLQLKSTLEKYITTEEAVSFLGISRHMIRRMASEKAIGCIADINGKMLKESMYLLSDCRRIYEAFENGLSKKTKPVGKHINLAKTLQKLQPINITLTKFANAVCNGEITAAGKTAEPGLPGFYFRESDVESFFQKNYLAFTGDVISMTKIKLILNISRSSIEYLCEQGFLIRSAPVKRHLDAIYITRNSFEKFKESYISSKEFSYKNRRRVETANKFLAKENISPVIVLPDCPVNIYRRKDVEDLKIIKPNKRKSYPATYLFSTEQIIELCAVTEAELRLLVENGVVEPYRGRKAPAENNSISKLMFSKSTIEKLKELGHIAVNLVSRKKASAILGISVNNFIYRYIKTNKVKSIAFSGRQYHLYSEVVKMLILEKEGIRASTAAEILMVNISCVNKLTIAGELIPVSGPRIDGFQYNVYIRSEVEKLKQKREEFKENQLKAGKSSRFGRVSGNRYSKIQKAKLLENKQ